MRSLSIISAIVRQDLLIWTRRPFLIAVTLLPTIGLFVIILISSAAVGRNPIALVVQGSGSHTDQLVKIIEDSDAFIVNQASPDQAARELQALQVEAVITIPATFDSAFDVHQADPVRIDVNNLNLDFTNDLRRSLPAAITEFYVQQPNSPVKVNVAETDLRSSDISPIQFELVPMVSLLITMAGVINAGLGIAREWEGNTIKELLLAPVSRTTITISKIASGWITTVLIALVIVVLGAVTGLLKPQGPFWLVTLLMIALIALTSVGLGLALGSTLRRIQSTTVMSVVVTLYLFFLSGGIAVAAFLPDWIQAIAHFIPTYYGVHALQMAIFYQSTDLLLRDTVVLVVTSAITLIIGVASLNRQMGT